MNATEAFAELRQLGGPVVETREAMARLNVSRSRTTQLLRELEAANLAAQLHRGLWLLDRSAPPFSIAPYLTAPFPAYVSLYSALSLHRLIEQIPHQISVVSLDRPRKVDTPVATYSIHHIAPELFGGFTGTPESGYVASPEKALFDTVYLPASKNRRVYLPEIELPADFDEAGLHRWTATIGTKRQRTFVARALADVLNAADRA